MSYSALNREDSNLLRGVNMGVESGKVTALIGGNGTGKTTLFNIISGYEKNFKGQILFKGQNITGMPAYRIASMGIGRLFQGPQLMEDLTLMENLKMGGGDSRLEGAFSAIFRGRAIRESETGKEKQAIALLKEMLGDDNKYLQKLNDKASDLSYGERRLIAMIRLMMGNNSLLLLDEPTSGINPKNIEAFSTIIKEMVSERGLTVLLIEHNMNFIRSVADCCNYMADGRIIKTGDVEEILDDQNIRKDYLGL